MGAIARFAISRIMRDNVFGRLLEGKRGWVGKKEEERMRDQSSRSWFASINLCAKRRLPLTTTTTTTITTTPPTPFLPHLLHPHPPPPSPTPPPGRRVGSSA
ncbi:hypothetical protein M0802_000375 [Mischocyttarus mexicanus]|nr:hypothetical protein M0802_000375 [Mischocyttarus mexicanus]